MNKILFLGLFFFIVSLNLSSQSLEPTDTQVLLICTVTDYDKVPEEAATVIIQSEDKSFSKQGISDIDGIFKLLVPEGIKYKVVVKKFGKDFFFNIDIPKVDGPTEFSQNFGIKLIKFYVRSYTLDHMFFDTNKWNIKEESVPTLNKLLSSFTSNPKLKVEIAGYTDNIGEETDNIRLSQKRADSIREFLIKKGVDANRLLSKGYGEKFPIASNDTETGRGKNRRTEVKVIEE